VAITLKDLQAFAQARINEGIANPVQFPHRVKDILDFAAANEASKDAESNAYLNNLIDVVADMYEQGLGNLPDGPDKRRLTRAIATTKRTHHRAEDMLKRLGMPLPVPIPAAEAAKPIFLEAQQSVLDLLWDATRQSQRGVAQFATLGLLYWAFDELTAAFYLAERRYTTQAYSHLRTVHDLMAKTELFFQEPKWADVWGSDDTQQILAELSPPAVRKKLGRPKFDPVYGFFSELGTHGTFQALRKRVTRTGKKEDRTQLAMRIGGTPRDSEVEMSVACCVLTVLSTLITIGKVYQARLHEEEVLAILRARLDRAGKFLQDYFVEPSRKADRDAPAITEILKKMMLDLKAVASNARGSESP
jgi:hypothetical protein